MAAHKMCSSKVVQQLKKRDRI